MQQLQNLVRTGRIQRHQRILFYGPNGIGKTSLARKFPDPIFVDAEDGSTHQDLARIQTPTHEQFFEALRVLANEPHQYKTLVIDTIDVAEKFIRERVLKRHKMKSIEDFGYGRGWTRQREEFDSLLVGCLDTFIRRGMHVVIIGHSTVKRIQPPGLSDAYDRHELKLDLVDAAKLREWSDAVLFLNWDIRISESAEGRVRGVAGRERMIYTAHCAAYDAKNRVGLPEKVECNFAALAPLLGDLDAPESRQAPGKEQAPKQAEPLQAASSPTTGVTVPPPDLSPRDNGAATATPQQRLATALSDEDPEIVRLFLLNRKICADGLIQSVPDDYATRALEHLSRFRERLTQFSKEPF
jgi:hypothetical protein